MRDKSVLLIGGSGFLGGHLAVALASAGWEITSCGTRDLNLTEYEIPQTLSERKFSLIILLSAWTQAGTFCDTHRGEQWLMNEAINVHALRFWHEHQPQAKFVAFGTSASYDESLGFAEETYLEGAPADHYAAYAWSKRSLLIGLQSLAKQCGYSFLYLVPSTLVGPGYHLDGRQLHFIYDIVRKCLRSRLDDSDAVLWGDGNQRRELIDVRDAAKWIVELAQFASGEIINLGAGEDYSIRELAAMVCENIGLPLERLRFNESAFVGARAKILDITKLNLMLPNRPQTDIRNTLNSLITWAMDNNLENYIPKPFRLVENSKK